MNEERKPDGMVKSQIKEILNARGESWFGFILLVFIAGLASILLTAAASSHVVQCYYLKTNATSAGLSYMVMGDIPWGEDLHAFSSADPKETLEVISNLKQCASK
jgi:hypothetical protein